MEAFFMFGTRLLEDMTKTQNKMENRLINGLVQFL